MEKRILFILLFGCLFFSCKKNDPTIPMNKIPVSYLELISSFPLNVLEPSGLCLGPNNATFLTVSDNTNKIYEIDFSGNTLRTLAFKGIDLEGITYNPKLNTIAVIEEGGRNVVMVDYESGLEIGRYHISIEENSANKGLEGISYNKNNSIYYIVNEDAPGLLVLWSPMLGIIDEIDLKFASDYSGIFVDDANSLLWVVSDESKALYKCDYNTNVLHQYNVDELKFEGISIVNNLIYMVNDASAKLYVYKIKD